ncbi:MAG TPA: TIGR03620 family F420-dependent LLM class oxidoreductase [Acidimicrobiales bacterium]|nr:TIGR03620 family F420-dependent LLM class oxidoreductase [Acidimicrobiales bacterium]
MTLTGTGIWAADLRYGQGEADPDAAISEAAAELEALGYTAAWIPDIGGDVFGPLTRLLDATSTMTVATGILNVWMQAAPDAAAFRAGLAEPQRRRLLLGLGVSHGALIGDKWAKPIHVMTSYLDALDSQGFPPEGRCLAALGPRMLSLAAARSAGAHPYLVTPEHTVRARAALGAGALLAPEQGVVLERDAGEARAVARANLGMYAALPNYANNWRRLGFSEEDVSELSDRLVDALVAWGDAETIARRVQEHRDAGADHVCVQVLGPPGAPMPRPAWRELAPAVV